MERDFFFRRHAVALPAVDAVNDTRPLDIVLYGATGFTGTLVAEYLARHQGFGLRWALAGRNREKLERIRDQLGAAPSAALLYADSADPASIRAMAAQARCVCSVVGPYASFGSVVVAACAELGTGYVDLTGEPLWMHEMIGTHEQRAIETGARIVHSCGFDSVPFDLGVLHLQTEARRRFGAPCRSVHARVLRMKGAYSGGTAASLNATEDLVVREPALGELLSDPFCLVPGFRGPDQPAADTVYEDASIGQWVAPFIMAVINSKNIHRSNALMGHPYGSDFEYDEMIATGPGERGLAVARAMASTNPLRGPDAPKPGEGPSIEVRNAGSFEVLLIGRTADGQELRSTVVGDMDPGYGATSKMLAESAACLVQDCEKLTGGFYTPAPAFGEKLIARLTARAGLDFSIQS